MFSQLVRQVHRYAALFLMPWLLLYACSTLVMNHRAWFQAEDPWRVERRQALELPADSTATRAARSEQVLRALGLAGGFRLLRSGDSSTFSILRTAAIQPRRVTYDVGLGTAVVERQPFRIQPFLEGLHRRHGSNGFRADDLWARAVDLTVLGMLLWICSGLWMWWEMKVTRRLGALLALGGLALFALLSLAL